MSVKIITLRKKNRVIECSLEYFITRLQNIKYTLLQLYPEKQYIIQTNFVNMMVKIWCLKKTGTSCKIHCLRKKQWISLDNKDLFTDPTSLAASWLQILALELVRKEKDLKPFWNPQLEEKSKQWWVPDSPLSKP